MITLRNKEIDNKVEERAMTLLSQMESGKVKSKEWKQLNRELSILAKEEATRLGINSISLYYAFCGEFHSRKNKVW